MPVWSRREWALSVAAGLTLPNGAIAQNTQKKAVEPPAAEELAGPDPIPPDRGTHRSGPAQVTASAGGCGQRGVGQAQCPDPTRRGTSTRRWRG
jgi:hypothetical protein